MDASNIEFAKEIAALVVKQLTEKPVMPRAFFDHKEAAAYLRLSPRSLEAALAAGKGPKVHRAGGSKRLYRREDLEAWVQGGAS